MSDLTHRDRELVALGAAMGSNCVPCIEFHIPESRKVGLSDPEIHAAIRHADKIRQVPARKTLQAALNMLPLAAGEVGNAGTSHGCGCAPENDAESAGRTNTAQPPDMMMGMMSKMMDTCGSQARPASAPNSAGKKPAVNPATSEGYGCS
ncbi:carboxymuconolactone decarboxylase family protein [Candidatus Accumulibacter vicinus]|uniref:Alkylhydroperoxidase AhpD family core domain protein n=1 Tax=Candidatus Accumulibacter vicinus TaxID=2954382 RepID=A0A084XWS9_9PROT|nr:carboxymuconolactone decarboxylase family protein [Candidatus Accumulibacter vicinus]KFB66923.1 MAG: alkylhydroperoxidase AhpD family core domain protein [Candidatus Accumulibacter vicinus]